MSFKFGIGPADPLNKLKGDSWPNHPKVELFFDLANLFNEQEVEKVRSRLQVNPDLYAEWKASELKINFAVPVKLDMPEPALNLYNYINY